MDKELKRREDCIELIGRYNKRASYDLFDQQKNNMLLRSEIMRDIEASMNNRFLEKLSPIVSDIIERIEKEEDEKEQRLTRQFEVYKRINREEENSKKDA